MFKEVPIPVYLEDTLTDYQDLWSLAVSDRIPGKPAWGLAYGGRLTHMCYGMDYASPEEALNRVKHLEWWHFDAGRKLRVKISDLEKGFKQLDLI